MLALPIQSHRNKEIHSAAYRLAARFSLPATYDAYYLATAEASNAELWTSDRRLARAFGDELPWVKLLDNA